MGRDGADPMIRMGHVARTTWAQRLGRKNPEFPESMHILAHPRVFILKDAKKQLILHHPGRVATTTLTGERGYLTGRKHNAILNPKEHHLAL